jgi:eukaryotic-like serine/threonine-protein kinase
MSTLATGTRVGAYEIVSLLGMGGMGEVYRARDTKLGRDVAIKILPSSVAAEPERLARFEREARLLASLNHPHIAQIYGVEESSGMTALVLEFVAGDTLAARLKGSRSIGVGEALTIARQIADALDAAHERGIVHRDLKPANIVITPDGTVKVLDFGLAKTLDERSPSLSGGRDLTQSPTAMGPTIAGVLLGTAPYMSPEQARGKAVDKRTDIWAFGCVLYEMLAGRRAFPGETTTDSVAAILERDPDLSALTLSTPSGIRHLLHRCLEKDPKRRLRDIADARADLDENRDATVPPAARAGVRAPAVWLLGGVVTGATLALAATAVVKRAGSTATAPTFSRVVRLTTGPALESAPALSPDGKWVAYLSDARGPTDIWVRFVAGGDPINLTVSTKLTVQPRTEIGGLAVSPDGSMIAFDASDSGPASVGVWVLPAPVGGTPRKLLASARAARWSPDGTKLVAVAPGGSSGDAIIVADADGGNAREIARRHGGMHKHWPAWSDDGRYVYFNYSTSTANAEPSEIFRVPASGGDPEPVVTTTRRAVFPVLLPHGRGLIYAANPTGPDLSLWWRPLGGGAPTRLTTGVGEYAQPSASADGRVVVATLVDPRQSISVVPVDGSDVAVRQHPLGDADTGDLDPSLASDGQRITFSSTRGGNRNIWIAAADGTNARPLTSGNFMDERPAFSPDGKLVAFISDRAGARGIWIVSAEGGSARLVAKAQVLDTIAWSPDGTEIVFGRVSDQPGLDAVRAADGSLRHLDTPTASIGAAGPSWSSRGDIAYIDTRPAVVSGLTSTRLAVVTGTGQPRRLLTVATIGNGATAWDPSGRRLAVYGNSGAVASVVFIIEPDSDQPRRLLDFPPDVSLRGLAWSADGKSLLIGQQRRNTDIVLFEPAQ